MSLIADQHFIADKQTMDDLNVLGKYKNNSIYSIFNQVQTTGGEKLLDVMFQRPMIDAEQINTRSKRFQYFGAHKFDFPFGNKQLGEMENYLSLPGPESLLAAGIAAIRKKSLQLIGLEQEYHLAKTGLQATIAVLNDLKRFLQQIGRHDLENPYHKDIELLNEIFLDQSIQQLLNIREDQEISLFELARYDHLLKHKLWNEMKVVAQMIYHFDVAIAVAEVARQKGFSYAHALPGIHNVIRMKDFCHPGLTKAVSNSLQIDKDSNVMFLTGANMAGKSTFMKSFGICIYLAHMGFPVAAKEMEFSVKDGIYSSINVPDNLSLGYSHFYAEVLRVKKIAEQVSASKNLIVIFDELFKGTNVKDAYDATLAVTEAFAVNRNCSFLISTHIIEVGQELMERSRHMQFVYLPTVMKGLVPTYTYQLQKGITADRHGMMIIENEKILEIILSDRTTAEKI